MTNNELALDAALKIAAPDGGSYLSGQHTFNECLANGVDIDTAIHEALLKATPTEWKHFQDAYEAFWTTLEPPKSTLADKIMGLGSSIKEKAHTKATSDRPKRSFKLH